MYRAANKGARCSRWQRVPGPRGGRRLLRCRRFRRWGKPTGKTPANYGKTCKRMKQVFGPWYNKKVWRCASYGPGKSRRPTSSGPVLPIAVERRPRPVPVQTLPILYPFGTGGDEGGSFRVPLSLPSIEKTVRGRTPTQMRLPGTTRRRPGNPRQLTFSY